MYIGINCAITWLLNYGREKRINWYTSGVVINAIYASSGAASTLMGTEKFVDSHNCLIHVSPTLHSPFAVFYLKSERAMLLLLSSLVPRLHSPALIAQCIKVQAWHNINLRMQN